MAISNAQKNATLNFRKKHIKRTHLVFAKGTMNDVIEKLETVPSAQGYIIELIRNYAKEQKGSNEN